MKVNLSRKALFTTYLFNGFPLTVKPPYTIQKSDYYTVAAFLTRKNPFLEITLPPAKTEPL